MLIRFILIILFFTAPVLAREILVLHIHGDWCPTCTAIDPVLEDLQPFLQSKNIPYLVFDQTNPNTLIQSKEIAQKFNLNNEFEYYRHTGEVLFIDQHTHELIATYVGVKDLKSYTRAIALIQAGHKIKDHKKQPTHFEISQPSIKEIKKAKIYAINIHHNMCGTCKITTPPFEAAAKKYINDSEVVFFTFDLSGEKEINITRAMAKELNLQGIYENHKHTGEVLFIDPSAPQGSKIKASLVAEKDISKYHEIVETLRKEIFSK